MIVTEKRLVQWDTNKKVQVSSEETFNEVHFYNKFSDFAEAVSPKEGYADIPNHFLQTGDDITVWLVNSTVEGDTSIEKAVLEVTPRKKPADYVYTETEILSYKALEERVERLEQGGVTPSPDPTPGSGMTEEEREQLNKNTEDIDSLKTRVGDVEDSIGEIDDALDRIIEIQNSLMGGGSK